MKKSKENNQAIIQYLEERVAKRTEELLNVNGILQKELAEHKIVEQELNQSKKLLECVFNGIQDGISILDKDFNIIKTNRTIKKWYSHATPIHGQKCFKVFHGESEPCAVCPAVRTLEKGTHQFEVIPFTRPKEGIGIIEMHAFPLKDEKNNVMGVVMYVRDITRYKDAERKLEKQKKALEKKNIALSVILGRFEVEKKKIQDDIIANVQNHIMPILQKLILKGKSRKYIEILHKNLQELTSSYVTKLTDKGIKLTAREIEICDMIKNGLTGKEISSILHVAYGTIERHRNNIRNKLGIKNKNITLSSFLKTL